MESNDQPDIAKQPTIFLDMKEIDPTPGEPLRSGALCPACGTGRLDYDGNLNLACPHCGFAQAGCFT